MLKVIIPNSKIKLKQQIKALEYAIRNDNISKNDKDREIHNLALSQLKQALNQ